MRLARLLAQTFAAATVITGGGAFAASFPDKPIRMVVGFPPGGGVDTFARLFAAEMEKDLGQTIVIDNKAGAGGAIGADHVARAAPDGYTILMGNTGSLAINPNLHKSIQYTIKDFAPVGLAASSPLLFAVHSDFPQKNLKDFIDVAKASPDSVTFGTGGAGSISHLATAVLESEAGISMVHVPYKGGAPAINDLLGQQIDMAVDGVPLIAPHVNAGKLTALAVTSPQRSPLLPETPTVAEAGFPEFNITAWYGIVAPKGTPAEVVKRLSDALVKAAKSPALVERVRKLGADSEGSSPEQFESFLNRESEMWKKAIAASGAASE